MYTEWTQHLSTDKEKEEFEREIHGSKRVLQRLKAIIEQRETNLDKLEMSAKDFETPNWAYKQAFRNGHRSALEIVKKYISIDQQEKSIERLTK